jgi:site-specific DNA recombinase
MLTPPAYTGPAAFGKTRQGPLRPRHATSPYDTPREDWLPIPVPAIVDTDVFVAVPEQWQVNKAYARQSQRGARSLLQGLVQCQQWGYAFYGKPIRRKAAKGKLRAYAYYRCLGTDAYRFGGERVCQNTQVRTALLDLAGWQEVGGRLAHPERLAEEYQRRAQANTSGKRQEHTTLEAQGGKWRQGLARLIDSYAEGLLEKHEFEPRITRLRHRMAQREEQRQQLEEMDACHAELRLIIGRLEDFATKVHNSLEEVDWLSKREMIRALVKRLEVAQNQVHVVCRVDQRPGDPSAEKKRLHLCRRSREPPPGQHIPSRPR